MRLLIVTDAWDPQVNGVVRTLKMTSRELRAACLAALQVPRERARAHAERFSWAAAAQQFASHLAPFAGRPAPSGAAASPQPPPLPRQRDVGVTPDDFRRHAGPAPY